MRLLIFDYILHRGPTTCEEIESRLQLKHQTASARISELTADGWLVDTGKTRNGYAVHRAVSQEERAQKELFAK